MAAAGQQQSVRTILGYLKENLKSGNLKATERDDLLSQLKVLGRDVKNLGMPFFGQGINTLGAYAFGSYPQNTCREALRCIANALLLVAKLRKTFVDLGFDQKAAKAFASPDVDDEFLLSRTLFLLTYEPTADFELLVNDLHLLDNIIAHIARHAEQTSLRKSALPEDQMSVMALSETLKLLFNVANGNKQQMSHLSSAVPDLLILLGKCPIKEPPLQPPLTYILNALAALDFDKEGESQSSSEKLKIPKITEVEVKTSISILERAIYSYSPAQLETQAIPVLTVLRKMNRLEDSETRKLMRDDLIPKDSERDLPLGKSSSLASQLLNLTTSPGLLNLPEAISSLLFEISDSDASEYVRNVGYGFAAGYLMAHDIPIPEAASQSERQESKRNQVPINPVTGQRLDKEPKLSEPPMTREEKEREAERLYVLFERLKATGVVDVKNPVQQAREEGRFEELSDSDS